MIDTKINDYIVCSSNPRFLKENRQRRYIITGAPGTGKTSIIHHLNKLGHFVIHEAAADVISIELAKGIEKPWEKEGFREKLVTLHEKKQQEAISLKTPLVFFDRSPLDTLSFCLMLKAIPSKELKSCVQNMVDTHYYENTVFLIERLDFYEQTHIRSESEEESLIVQEHLESNYTSLGFQIIRIPKDSVEARSKQILSYI